MVQALARFVLAAVVLLGAPWSKAADITPTERAWLEAALPVLAYADAQALPVDIVVQPQPTPGETPLGLAFVDGRCKLVLSMRGNPEAQATLDRIEPALRDAVVEAIVAHEMAHCWRRVQRHWGTLPERLADVSEVGSLEPGLAAELRRAWQTRREEAYADLVGLAWTLHRHPALYTQVHAWHVRLRAEQEFDTGPHDTRVWVRLAADTSRFVPAASIFEQVHTLWVDGLLAGR